MQGLFTSDFSNQLVHKSDDKVMYNVAMIPLLLVSILSCHISTSKRQMTELKIKMKLSMQQEGMSDVQHCTQEYSIKY